MSYDENLRALLDAAKRDGSLERRLLLLEALLGLPLSDGDWLEVGDFANALLMALLVDGGSTSGASVERWLGLFARVPLASIRYRLRALTRVSGAELGSSAAHALATQRDARGLAVLLQDFSRTPNERTAFALSRLPAESLAGADDVLSTGLAASDSMVGLWSAIALAKAQTSVAPRAATRTIEALWNTVVRVPEGEAPPLFWGNPWSAVGELSKARPLPIALREFLLSLKDRDFDSDWRPRDSEIETSARSAQLLVAGLTGAYDVDGEPVGAPAVEQPAPPASGFEGSAAVDRLNLELSTLLPEHVHTALTGLTDHDRAVLRAQPRYLTGGLIPAFFAALLAKALPPAKAELAAEAGNALLSLANALPTPLLLDLPLLLDNGALLAARLTRPALAWTLARAGLHEILAAFTPRIAATTGDAQSHELTWLRDIAQQMDAPPPYQGAGGEERSPEPRPLVDDDPIVGLPRQTEFSLRDSGFTLGFRAALPPLDAPPPAPPPAAAAPPSAEPPIVKPRAAERSPSPVEPVAGSEPVDAAVFCPGQVARGDSFLVQVFLYPPPSEEEVALEARQADDSAQRRGKTSLPLDLPPGTRVDLHLEMRTLTVFEPDAVVVWRGRSTAAQFEVAVPQTLTAAQATGMVSVAVAGMPNARLGFVIQVVAAAAPQPVEPIELDVRRYRKAFVSYSSADRAEVLRRVQILRLLGIETFQDILDLKPGELWERALYRRIDECDVFFLFWSSAAAASPWVAKEIAYALARKADNTDNPPDIQPVPLEGPPLVPPPPSLSALHFNDALLAHIRAADEMASTLATGATL